MKHINYKLATKVNKIELLELDKMKSNYFGGILDLKSEKSTLTFL